MKSKELSISISAIKDMIRFYTREAGVRNLEREISKLARKVDKITDYIYDWDKEV